ncbi:hypothetical protein ABGB07_40465 [Micromonosporaceae bacterium B7E4]
MPSVWARARIDNAAGDPEAAARLLAEVDAVELSAAERTALGTDLATAAEISAELGR